jgi:hypothetical protein
MRSLPLIAALLCGTLAAGPVFAQAPAADDSWRYEATLYMLGASMDGTTGVNSLTADVDVPFSDILDNLEFGAMGRMRAARGHWAFGLDFIYMGLGASTDRPPADVDLDQSLAELSVGFVYSDRFESFVGLRYALISADIRFQGPLGTLRSGDVDWWDPFIGGRATFPMGENWKFKLRGDVGGFGVGSDFAWQVETLFTRAFSPGASFEIGYRWIDVDYRDDDTGFVYDVLTQGPQAGVTLRF